MRAQVHRIGIAVATIGSVVAGVGAGTATAAVNQAPVVPSGSLTVHYEDVYSIHFTASDPDGDALSVTVPPVNEDWIGCDGGPAQNQTCEYSSSRYYDPAPLPTKPTQKVINYSVTDGTATTTGSSTITILPPPPMKIVGQPTITEGGTATLQLQLSANTFGSLLVQAQITEVNARNGAVGPTNTVVVNVADGQTTADIAVPIDDNATVDPVRYFTVGVAQADAIPYRFEAGGNLVTVLDNDGRTSTDVVAPVVAAHRNVKVERTGDGAVALQYAAPLASDDVDGRLSAVCSPASLTAFAPGLTTVSCAATDAAGNHGSSTFKVTVGTPTTEGRVKSLLGDDDRRCATPGQFAWVSAGGFTPGSQVALRLQSASLTVVDLTTVTADRKGRVRQVVQVPASSAGEAYLVLAGAAGNDDLVRMLALRIGRDHHRQGAVLARLRNNDCD
jgi:hypothetical protein